MIDDVGRGPIASSQRRAGNGLEVLFRNAVKLGRQLRSARRTIAKRICIRGQVSVSTNRIDK